MTSSIRAKHVPELSFNDSEMLHGGGSISLRGAIHGRAEAVAEGTDAALGGEAREVVRVDGYECHEALDAVAVGDAIGPAKRLQLLSQASDG